MPRKTSIFEHVRVQFVALGVSVATLWLSHRIATGDVIFWSDLLYSGATGNGRESTVAHECIRALER
jgi:hypothetical protein